MHNRKSIKSNGARVKSDKTLKTKQRKFEETQGERATQKFVATVGGEIKPGLFTTIMLLNVLGAAVQPTLAVLLPHQSTANDLERNIRARVTDFGGSHQGNPCIGAITNAAESSVELSNRLKKTFDHHKTPSIYCATQTLYNPYLNRVLISQFLPQPADINKVILEFLTSQRHQSQACPSASPYDAIFPLYPKTGNSVNELTIAIESGNDRIKDFHQLLQAFKNLDAGDHLALSTAASSGDLRLREFKKLLFQSRYREKLKLTTTELDRLERYMNASRDCLLYKLKDKVFDKKHYYENVKQSGDAVYVFDGNTNSHLAHQGSMHLDGSVHLYNTVFAHRFDAVAHLTHYINEMKINDVTDQVYTITSILSDNAMNVFYPELNTLLKQDELRCERQHKIDL